MAGCAKPQPASNTDQKPEVTSTGVVKATALETNITGGESAEAVVRLKIDHGYHVNANPPSFAYLIPTQLELTPPAGISVESISYPNALTKKFSFSEQPLAVYEGEADVKVRLRAEKSTAAGVHNLSAKLRVQACDDQVCYAPGSIDLTIPVSIK
ncbi:MAG TPA: protein-disulfide reductase DsbD domain-containing protein [Pyrinomonadaceae bacterium]|nr:protein-disulfide reductase DsbD domain-containing protein [Pyrinomonadaceae bacterium]